MFFYLYTTCVAAVLFDIATLTPVSQILPTSVCPPTHYLYNGACFLGVSSGQQIAPITAVGQPCTSFQSSTCQTAAPCQAVSNGIPTTVPCQATSSCTNSMSTYCSQPQCQVTCNQACTIGMNCAVVCQPPCQTCVNQCCCNQNQCCGCCNQNQCCACRNQNQCCKCEGEHITTPHPPTTTPHPPTTTPLPPTTTPPPCPKGTILFNGECHLLYCGSGTLRNGKCIVTVCPDGSVWTGSKCEIAAPENHTSLNISNLVITNVNQTSIQYVVNQTSNLNIYITESSSVTDEVTTTSPRTNCCIIVTPVTCVWNNHRHECNSKRYRRCGSVCTNIYIYLTPPIIVPPPPPPCFEGCHFDNRVSFYPDCTSCIHRRETCWAYCQRSVCETSSCHSVGLRDYCGNYPGSIGCRRDDGCISDWCGSY